MGSFVMQVPASVTLRSAADFSRQLLDACEAHAAIDLDLSALAELDLSFIQIVEAARAHREREGGTIRLARPAGGAVAATLDRAGFLTDPASADIDFWFHGDLPQ